MQLISVWCPVFSLFWMLTLYLIGHQLRHLCLSPHLNFAALQVSVNGAESICHDVTSGIPQGSVLGPILFVIYINDMPDHVDSEAYLFADDTKVYKEIKTVPYQMPS
jgi:hypothetical protein